MVEHSDWHLHSQRAVINTDTKMANQHETKVQIENAKRCTRWDLAFLPNFATNSEVLNIASIL